MTIRRHHDLNAEEVLPQEISFENDLRPKFLKDYIGQSKVKEKLEIFMSAAKARKENLDHSLFYGPPGLGKTTLANIIAHEMGAQMRATSGPIIEKAGDLAAILTSLEEGDVLFIDEIHRLNPQLEEMLYPAMEDYQIDILIGQGPSAKTVKLDLPRFTLVAATTRTGLLTSPLRDRFGIIERLQYYNAEDLTEIVSRSAKILGVEIEADGAYEIAKRSRGTPRIVNRLLKRVRDYVQVKSHGIINKQNACAALDLLEVDLIGLDPTDRKILEIIIHRHDGGPVGVEAIAAALSEQKDTLEDVYEPFLIQEGYISRSPRGRVATQKAYEHLGMPFKIKKNQDDFF